MSVTARARSEDGFTLPELLTSMTIAMIVALAVLGLLDFTVKRAAEISGRVEATQQGRLAMDSIVRELRSQVCPNISTSAMTTRTGNITDGSYATFYIDFTDGSGAAPDLHTIAYDSVTNRIIVRAYKPSAGVYPAAGAPSSTRVLLPNVVRDGSTPVFTYWAGDTLLSPATGGLTAAELATITQIDVAFKALPRGGSASARNGVVVKDQVYVRSADPNADNPTPACS